MNSYLQCWWKFRGNIKKGFLWTAGSSDVETNLKQGEKKQKCVFWVICMCSRVCTCVRVCVLVFACAKGYVYGFSIVVLPSLSGSGACIVINSTSTREQINGGCTVMECMVKRSSRGGWLSGEKENKEIWTQAKKDEREVGKCYWIKNALPESKRKLGP